ncbi:MAG: toprim domain-containing protein [Balneolaceae bacterium]
MQVHPNTLLIVESAVIAQRLREHAPPFVTLFATEGYIWDPVYDHRKNRLKTRAQPEKRDVRKELRLQASYASRLVIATDHDPSGDFIAWSIARFLNQPTVDRSAVQTTGPGSVERMLHRAQTQDATALRHSLAERMRNSVEWKKNHPTIPESLAVLQAIRESKLPAVLFHDGSGSFFQTEETVCLPYGKPVPFTNKQGSCWLRPPAPPDTFSLLEPIREAIQTRSYKEAQEALHTLFFEADPATGNGLITYPRTAQRAYYNESWQDIDEQWVKRYDLEELLPYHARAICPATAPHDAVRPLRLHLLPEQVHRITAASLSAVYEVIHRMTMSAISRPVERHIAGVMEADNRPVNLIGTDPAADLQEPLFPVLTVAMLGTILSAADVLRASSFGRWLDRAVDRQWIGIENGTVTIFETKISNSAKNEKISLLRSTFCSPR